MIGELGSTTDPAMLVHGSPSSLRADALALEGDAQTLQSTASGVEGLSVENWVGQSAATYETRRGELAATTAGIADIYMIAAGTLRNHAEMVAWGQAQAQIAIDLYEQGCNSWSPSERTLVCSTGLGNSTGSRLTWVTGAPMDTGSTTRARAQRILSAARSEVTASALAVVGVMDELSAGLPDGRWHTGEFLAGVGDWLTGVAGLVLKFSHLRALIDPDGYRADVTGARDAMGLLYDQSIRDPVGAGRNLLDLQTLQDNPARWWGAQAPDVAISIATAGAGTAAGALSRAGRASRVVEGMADAADVAQPSILNRLQRAYPNVIDPRTGGPIGFPDPPPVRVSPVDRVTWDSRMDRGRFITTWLDRGYPHPPEGWAAYDIHHIRPREFGGGNDFDNLVPVLRQVHQDEFNEWWRNYP